MRVTAPGIIEVDEETTDDSEFVRYTDTKGVVQLVLTLGEMKALKRLAQARLGNEAEGFDREPGAGIREAGIREADIREAEEGEEE